MKRKTIPKVTKDLVYLRQNSRCACCIEKGREYHHVKPVALGGNNDYFNIVFLCKEHHRLLHLGDLETITQVLEYVYYLKNGELPISHYQIELLAREISQYCENTQVVKNI